jgi:hypothetical protein
MPDSVPARVAHALEACGLLLVTDRALPSVAGLIAGEPIRGSWWGHPAGRAIYAACCALEDRGDVLAVTLVSGKVTYVLRRLWPALLGVAAAREAWQTRRLSAAARELLAAVDAEGEVELAGRGKAAGELQRHLLVHGRSMHTQSSAHQKVLCTWEAWRREAGWRGRPLDAAAGRAVLEAAAQSLGPGARLPW